MYNHKLKPKIVNTVKPKITMNKKLYNSLEILSMNINDLYTLFQALVKQCYFHYNYISSSPINIIETNADTTVLQDYLSLQLNTLKIPYNKVICNYIIECIDNNGFFTGSILEHCNYLQVDEDTFTKQLKIIQSLEPDGIGAQNPMEAILIQLKKDEQYFAIHLLSNYTKEIEESDFLAISEHENCDIEEIYDALNIIKDTNPYPGLCFDNSSNFTPNLVKPDLLLTITDNELILSPSKETSYLNELQLNKRITELPQFKEFMQKALFSIDCLTKRNTTLLLITNEIITIQKNYFLFNEQLRKCTLRSISKKLGITVSTISRCINNKYLMFNNELIPIRSLIITKKTMNDDDFILHEIKRIINKENKQFPYSDYEICLQLKKKNINISRRTVNKYRDILNIPNSRNRAVK